MIAALYVEAGGVYFGRPDVDPWDVVRDAKKYAGHIPIVAHPPCGPWSSLRSLSKEMTRDCALRAVDQVRAFGGVLEHPARSTLFDAAGLPKPGELPDAFGGRTIEVCQVDWGHVARKRTWIYLVGVTNIGPLPPSREPTHWCSGVHTPGARGKPPLGIKICSAQQRRRTPPAFADFLIGLAHQVRRAEAA
jgi:hypothetical protein